MIYSHCLVCISLSFEKADTRFFKEALDIDKLYEHTKIFQQKNIIKKLYFRLSLYFFA